MSAQVIDIGRYIKVPLHVVISQISPRALQVWTLIAADASPEDPTAHVHQPTLAKQLGCCTKTIGRAIAELARHNLLVEAGKWQKGRCKIYEVIWHPKGCSATREKKHIGNSKANSGTPIKESNNKVNAKPLCGQMEIPKECYVQVGAKTKPPKPAPKPHKELSEAEQEVAWIIAQIKASNEKQRYQEEMEAKRRQSFLARGKNIAPKRSMVPPEDLPITPENYPIMWGFLRTQWASRRQSEAA